jgi:hypothetical protein
MKRCNKYQRLVGRGIIYDRKDINKLCKFVSEKLDHFITKAMVFHILRSMKHDVVTEFEVVGLGQGDVYDLTTDVQYEIDNSHRPKERNINYVKYARSGVDIIVIDCDKLPADIDERYNALKGWVVG